MEDIVDKVLKASLSEELQAKNSATPTSFSLISTSYAQEAPRVNNPDSEQNIPSWVKKIVQAEGTLYFSGMGESTNADKAKAAALEGARDEAVVFVADLLRKLKIDESQIDKLIDPVSENCKEEQLDLSYNSAFSVFRGYALVSLKKSVLRTVLLGQAAGYGIPLESGFEKQVLSAERSPNDYVVRRTQIYEQSLNSTRAQLSVDDLHRFLQARNLRLDGGSKEAFPVLKKITELYPNFYLGWFNLALCARSLNNETETNRAFSKALEIDKMQSQHDPSIYATYAAFLNKQGKKEEAIKLLDEALIIEPQHPSAQRIRYTLLNPSSVIPTSTPDAK